MEIGTWRGRTRLPCPVDTRRNKPEGSRPCSFYRAVVALAIPDFVLSSLIFDERQEMPIVFGNQAAFAGKPILEELCFLHCAEAFA